ncbi:MAG TPA: saccharopine dehydrogenase NADP-binding domain-containing protein [Arenimonas sp.]|nr:saccharopine dehydrogenase NADP-binding domain-containing protein [Arenimonas sp.]
MEWMIYGANGYTGQLIAEAAVERGLKPVLAGRNAQALETLGQRLSLPVRVFGLDHAQAVENGLNGIALVLHCAGPFSQTCAPMLEGCLAVGAHYLDITGEIDVFAHCHAQHARAAQRGIVVLPGSGFDVVPTDCLAALLKARMPKALSLVLAFEAGGGPSPGTAKTSVEGLGHGGRVRKDGVLQAVPLAWKTRDFERDGQWRSAMTIPWGDVYTAFVSTGIPDIEVYMAMPPALIARMRRLGPLGPLLRWRPLQRWLQARIERRMDGPSARTRERSDCVVWGEVRDANGFEERLQLRTPNGYSLTVDAALGIAQRLLSGARPAGGYYTPSQLMGADYVLGLPGVRLA